MVLEMPTRTLEMEQVTDKSGPEGWDFDEAFGKRTSYGFFAELKWAASFLIS